MRYLRVAFALSLAAPLAACATTSTSVQISTAKAAGTAENDYQGFLVAQEKRVQAGTLTRDAFHASEDAAYALLLKLRAGKLTVDAFTAQLAALGA